MRCCAAAILAVAFGWPSPAKDVGYEYWYTSSPEEVANYCVRAPVPADLAGQFVIAGPAVFELGGREFRGLFDAFAKVNRFDLEKGQVCLTAKMLQSGFYNESIKRGSIAPGFFFAETVPPREPCPPLVPMCNMLGPNDNNFVNSVYLGDQLTMISDTVKSLDYDLESMTVTGLHKWSDHSQPMMHEGALMSAHPVRYDTGSYEIISEMPMMPGNGSGALRKGILQMVRIHDDAPHVREVVASVETERALYYHSFGITGRYAVLPENLELNFSPMSMFEGTITKAMKPIWNGVMLVDMMAGPEPQVPQRFWPESGPFNYAHVVNTYETTDGGPRVVFDVAAQKVSPFVGEGSGQADIMVLRNKTLRDDRKNVPGGLITRYELHLDTGNVTTTVFSRPGADQDFPKINPRFNGRKYCFVYVTEWFHDDVTMGSMAVGKMDVCNGGRTQYWSAPSVFPSEAVFVPKAGGAEDDGYLFVVAMHGEKHESHFVILDARTMEPVVDVPLPQPIPFTAHGEFYPRSARSVLV